jgi:hypothetical protein
MAPSPSSITSSDVPPAPRAEWLRLGRVLFLAIGLPWLFLPLLTWWIGWQVGELMPADVAAQRQAKDPSLVWYSYRSSSFGRFKLARVAIERPDILIVGQSRPQMFRSRMFLPYTEYNLGSVSYTMHSFLDLFHHLPPGYQPKVVIMACDFFLFNPVCTKANVDKGMLQDFDPPTLTDRFNVLRDILVQLPSHPGLLLSGLVNSHSYPTLGLSAREGKMGFRFDGSTKWISDEIHGNPETMVYPDWWDSTCQGPSMGAQEKADFEQLVAELHAKGTTLICVQLPLYKSITEPMDNEKKDKFGELQDFRDHIRDGYFAKLGVPIYDYLELPGYYDDYHWFLDELHPTEDLTWVVLKKMAADPEFQKALPKLDPATVERNQTQKAGP